MNKVVERFLKYVKIDTQSDPSSSTCPSTKKQFILAKELVKELEEIGLTDVSLDENGYVMATLPANTDYDAPVIGFIAHMDTSPDFTGKDVNPQFVENYDGNSIVLNEAQNIILSPTDFPELLNYMGKTLITTDGRTLLGADDKAGIAEIVTAMEYLVNHPEIKHGTIKVGFTPDEEVGRGADLFDIKTFGADFAYTLDGGPIGELEYENFNAASAKILIKGRNVHPGTAKNQMINALEIASELNNMLPEHQKPQYTEEYEGFFHLVGINGGVDEASIEYIIRDHDKGEFEKKKVLIEEAVNFLNYKYGTDRINLILKDQYYNMKKFIEPVMHIIDTAALAMREVGVTPKIKPIRGGTDGAVLSYNGLPCPNIFAGGHNFHGRFEYIPTFSMEAAVNVIVKIVELYGSSYIDAIK
ncbi:peptidase T [Haloplasma contractile]|uniref:Peptidase T n=1 Tax=Haloplasma contractile SSD-17B TaxID=1033810 RepID=F7PRF5_9MOLU|nr:peptidase T [Haloplasma contractile]ERJ11718.1 Peptidase T protein [Haloplasma contractile SSD-17B]